MMRGIGVLPKMLSLLFLAVATPVGAQEAPANSSDEARRIALIERASASVAELTATKAPREPADFPLPYASRKDCGKTPDARWDEAAKQCRMAFTPPPKPVTEVGSGVLIDAERGLLLTAAHIVDVGTLTARLPDGRTIPATLRAADDYLGLAVVAIDPAAAREAGMAALPIAALRPRAGQDIFLIGRSSPLDATIGITGHVIGTQGERQMTGPDSMPIGAPLHILDIHLPDGTAGGGPVLDARGAVAGIVLAIYGQGGGPTVTMMVGIDALQTDIARLGAGERVPRGWLGLNLECADAKCVIVNVEPDTPASLAGLRKGDILDSANGLALTSDRMLARMVRGAPPGSAFTLALTRYGVAMTVVATSIDVAAAARAAEFTTPR